MTTDNRTNEPTEAMILAALNAYSNKGLENDGYETTEEYPSLEMWGDRFASQMRAALVAAQGAAPQAESENRERIERAVAEATGWDSSTDLFDAVRDHLFRPRTQVAEDYTRFLMVRLADGLRVALSAPVLPSSGVDEDALAEVLREAEESWHLSDEKSHQSYACGAPDLKSKYIARAVIASRAEWLKGQER